jgi:hypothetical protein
MVIVTSPQVKARKTIDGPRQVTADLGLTIASLTLRLQQATCTCKACDWHQAVVTQVVLSRVSQQQAEKVPAGRSMCSRQSINTRFASVAPQDHSLSNLSHHSKFISFSLSSEESAPDFSTILTSMYNLAAIQKEGTMSANRARKSSRNTFHAYLGLSVSLANRKGPELPTAEHRPT